SRMLPRYSLPVINIVASQLIRRRRMVAPPHAEHRGPSYRAEFGCDLEEVQNIVAGMCTSITTRMKLHTIELELERLDVRLPGTNSGSQAQVIEHYFATAGSCIA